jgi:hypothetical protein
MDATQNVNLDGGGESIQTSAGLNSGNSAGVQTVDTGVLPRADENPEVRTPQLSITRLYPARIEGLNALSDEDVFEEARGEIYLPENLTASARFAVKFSGRYISPLAPSNTSSSDKAFRPSILAGYNLVILSCGVRTSGFSSARGRTPVSTVCTPAEFPLFRPALVWILSPPPSKLTFCVASIFLYT